jgi:antibiotic biosynthesis monooxygenase (ABM) superfamily enzyme
MARFLLTGLAAFLMIIALFSAFGRQLKAMSAPVRALLVSGVFVVAMNFLVMPGLARLLARFDPSTKSGARRPR